MGYEEKANSKTVQVSLDWMERVVVLRAAHQFYSGKGDGRGDYVGQAKLERIKRLMGIEEAVARQEAMNDEQADANAAWQQAAQAARAAGAKAPPMPKVSAKEKRGEEVAIPLPLGVHGAIVACLRSVDNWPVDISEFVVGCCEKFGLRFSDPTFEA